MSECNIFLRVLLWWSRQKKNQNRFFVSRWETKKKKDGFSKQFRADRFYKQLKERLLYSVGPAVKWEKGRRQRDRCISRSMRLPDVLCCHLLIKFCTIPTTSPFILHHLFVIKSKNQNTKLSVNAAISRWKELIMKHKIETWNNYFTYPNSDNYTRGNATANSHLWTTKFWHLGKIDKAGSLRAFVLVVDGHNVDLYLYDWGQRCGLAEVTKNKQTNHYSYFCTKFGQS